MTATITDAKKTAMLDRVRKLLAKAEAEGVTEPEAEMLTAKAAELMARYGIDKALAEAKAGTRAKPGDKKFRIQAPYADCKRMLLAVVGGAFGCHAIVLNTRGADEVLHMFGFDTDLEQVEMLYTSLLLQMSRALARHHISPFITGRALMAERRSFMLGFCSGVKPRLEAAYKQAVAEADDTGTTGAELVLASREVDVKRAVKDAYPTTRSMRVTYRGRSYGDGKDAGERANIHNRANVGQGGRALTR